MKLSDLPQYNPGDIIEIITRNENNSSERNNPFPEGRFITNQTRHKVGIILGSGTSGLSEYGDYVQITEGLIGENPTKAENFFLEFASEIKIYPRQK